MLVLRRVNAGGPKIIDQHGFRGDRRGTKVRDELLFQVGAPAAQRDWSIKMFRRDGEEAHARNAGSVSGTLRASKARAMHSWKISLCSVAIARKRDGISEAAHNAVPVSVQRRERMIPDQGCSRSRLDASGSSHFSPAA